MAQNHQILHYEKIISQPVRFHILIFLIYASIQNKKCTRIVKLAFHNFIGAGASKCSQRWGVCTQAYVCAINLAVL